MNFALTGTLLILCIVNIYLLYGNVFNYRKKKSAALFIILSSAAVIAGAASNMLDNDSVETFTELLLAVCSTVLPYTLFCRKKKTVFAFFGLMLCSVFDFIEYAAASCFNNTSWSKTLIIYNILYAAACIISLIIGAYLKSRRVSEFLENIPLFVFLAVFLVNYSAFYGLSVIRTSESYSVAAVIFNYVSACFSSCAISFFVYRYVVLSRKQKENELIFNSELKRYEEIIRNNRDVRAFRHDYKNNLFALETLIKSGRITEAEKYIHGLSDSAAHTENRFSTGNILADAILTDKSAQAEKFNIKISFSGAIPAEAVADRELCVILSNALDNAIEASCNITGGVIEVNSRVKENGMLMTVKNPVKEKVNIRNGIVRTSKSDRQNHGFGISNIRKAAKAYDGYVDLDCTDNYFAIEIGLIFKN